MKETLLPLRSHPETPLDSVFHHADELFMAQTVVPVQVENFEDRVQNIFGELLARGDIYGPLKLSCRGKHAGYCSNAVDTPGRLFCFRSLLMPRNATTEHVHKLLTSPVMTESPL